MCEGTEDYSTIVGPLHALRTLREFWFLLDYPRRVDLAPPELIRMDELGELAFRFSRPESPAVAVVRHPRLPGIEVASRLQAEVMVGHGGGRGFPPLPELLWEPGFRFQAAGAAPAAGNPFHMTELLRLASSAPHLTAQQRASGRDVAVLDSGLLGAGQMVDFLDSDQYGVRTTSANDAHGHGTAVAIVIQRVAPNAVIHPLRVLNQNCQGHSYEVFAGLLYALWSGAFQLINASLSSPVSASCDSTLGKSIDYLLSYCRANAGHSMPALIAAAGNGFGAKSGYPARLDGAVVALALDAQGNPAGYNSTPPQGATTMTAYGAGPAQPLGNLGPLTGNATDLWGTSFAAAAITGAHLP